MAEKTFHKGWLYERDGVKFAPYTLKENIVERDGTKWGENIGNSINTLSDSIDDILTNTIPNVENYIGEVDGRTTELEERTQYLDASESNTFYITDANGNIALRVDNDGATSFNFITPNTDLNSIYENVSALEDAVDNIYNESLSAISEDIQILHERTKFMNAGLEENTFYITDGNGNIGMKVDDAGVTSLEFIAGDMEIKSTIEGLLSTSSTLEDNVGDLLDRADNLESRTQYLDASDSSGFYITDASGNIGMVVDDNGVVAHKYFIIAPDKNEIPLIGYQKVSTITI